MAGRLAPWLAKPAEPRSAGLTRNEVEREKGFEPWTSTLATCPLAREIGSFARFKLHEGAARSMRVV